MKEKNSAHELRRQELFEKLWSDFYPRIYTFLKTGFNFTREDLEDLVQEIMFKAFSRRETYDSAFAMSTWVYTIARNKGIDLVRKQKRSGAIQILSLKDDTVIHGPVTPETRLISDETRTTVQKALAILKPRDRQIAFLWYFEGFTQAQIARVVDVPVGTVKYRVHEIKKLLRRELEDVYE